MKLKADAEKLLVNHQWPGNVRELENAIENAVVMCEKPIISIEDLPQYLHAKDYPESQKLPVILPDDELDYSIQLEMSEKQIIQKALKKADHNKTKASELLGISLRTMRYKVKKYSL